MQLQWLLISFGLIESSFLQSQEEIMSYSSTRGQDNKINFVDAMLNGLAKDGGLYVPDKFSKFSKKI